MANQQRSVIVTAIVLAVILGGALVWLLNRTPAEQLATQVPEAEAPATTESAGSDELVPVDEANQIAQAQQPQASPAATGISPTDAQQPEAQPTPGTIQGVTATAPTGPAEGMLFLAAAALILGSGGLLALSLPRL